MPRYLTKVDRLISHESRTVKAGEEFETEFPAGPGGKPMVLSDTLILIEEKAEKSKGGSKAQRDEG